jgi:hypothetical protein
VDHLPVSPVPKCEGPGAPTLWLETGATRPIFAQDDSSFLMRTLEIGH